MILCCESNALVAQQLTIGRLPPIPHVISYHWAYVCYVTPVIAGHACGTEDPPATAGLLVAPQSPALCRGVTLVSRHRLCTCLPSFTPTKGIKVTSPAASGFTVTATATAASGLTITAPGAPGFTVAAPGAPGFTVTAPGAPGFTVTAPGATGAQLGTSLHLWQGVGPLGDLLLTPASTLNPKP